MSWVIGFDLSLTAPAAVALPLDWRPGDWKRVKAWLLKPQAPKQDDLKGQLDRAALIASWAVKCAACTNLSHAYVEAYGFSKNNAQASKIMESGGIVKHELYHKFKIVLHPVVASSGRKLFLGKCPQKDPKLFVQDALFNKCGAPKVWDENQADAFVVANFGLSEFGGKCLTLST